MRRHGAERRHRQVHIVAIDIIHRIGIAGERQQLRMGDDGVPAFHESLHHHLPIGGHHLAHPHRRRTFLLPPTLEMLRHGREKFIERRPVRRLANEDIASPAPDADFGQGHLLVFQVREVPAARDLLDRPIIIPGESMKRALQLGRPAIAGLELAPAMQADIGEGPNRTILLPDQQKGFADILIDDMIARLRQFLFARRELPGARPHLLLFQLEKFGAGIAARRDRVRPQIFIFVGIEKFRHRIGVRQHQVADARARAARQRCAFDPGIAFSHHSLS